MGEPLALSIKKTKTSLAAELPTYYLWKSKFLLEGCEQIGMSTPHMDSQMLTGKEMEEAGEWFEEGGGKSSHRGIVRERPHWPHRDGTRESCQKREVRGRGVMD